MGDREIARGVALRRFALLHIRCWFSNAWPLIAEELRDRAAKCPPASKVVAAFERHLSFLEDDADALRTSLEAYVAGVVDDEDYGDAPPDTLITMVADADAELGAIPSGVDKAEGVLLGLVDLAEIDTDQCLDVFSHFSDEVKDKAVVRIVSAWKRELHQHLRREREPLEERKGEHAREQDEALPRLRQPSVSHIFWASSCDFATLDAVSRYRFMETFNIGEFRETRRQIENLVQQEIVDNGPDAAYELWIASRSPQLVSRMPGAIQIALATIMEAQDPDGSWPPPDGTPRLNFWTALSSVVLLRLGQSASHKQAGRDGAEYLANYQLPSGAWTAAGDGKGAATPLELLITTILAATAIQLADPDGYASTVALATHWILQQQEPTGTWDDCGYPFPFASVLATEYLAGAERQTEEAEPRDEDAYVFRRQGEQWVLRYQGDTRYFKDTKSIKYLHHLVSHAGEEFTAVQLLWAVDGEAVPEPTVSEASAASAYDDELFTAGLPDAGNVADAQAVREIRQRLKDLDEEENEAAGNNDLARLEPIVAEKQQLEEHLSKLLGLGGRPRKGGDHYARVRSRVAQNIGRGLKKIKVEHPRLHLHVKNAIRMTPLFTYRPDSPVDWSV